MNRDKIGTCTCRHAMYINIPLYWYIDVYSTGPVYSK